MLQTGTVLNRRYEILRLIAEGGMGAVYEGRDLKFGGSPVAIKRCLLSGEAMQRAFVREAELLANLSHPGVPKVRDIFVEAEGHYLVMEYIPGRDLEEILNDRGAAVPTEDALRWIEQALDALIYMHSQRPPVIHRDLKPSNLKLTPSGHVMLIDFGLAKGNGKSSVVGYSASYAPLEQLQDDGTDARSDLYSLGATLYRLLTGQEPESALSRVKQMAKDHRDPLLRVNAINDRVPAAVAQIIWDAMALEREERLQSADEMRRRFREAGKSLASSFQPAYTPTETVQSTANSSSVNKVDTSPRSIVHSAAGSSQKSSSMNGQVVGLSSGPDDIETGKTVRKSSKLRLALIVAGFVTLWFLTYSGISCVRLPIDLSQRQEVEQGQGTTAQGQQPEQRESTAQEGAEQKQVDDQAEQEAKKREEEAAAREAERQKQEEAAAREAERQKQEAAAREAEKQKAAEAAAREAERQRQEAAAHEAEAARQKAEMEAKKQAAREKRERYFNVLNAVMGELARQRQNKKDSGQ